MQAFIVGGYVRDLLLNRPSHDKDWVVVGATQEDMLELGFQKVGASFPVFLHPQTKQEYALARTERKQGQGYYGFEVDFSPKVTLSEDLARRDLTINSIALDPITDTIIDPYHGVTDLRNQVLRPVTDAFMDDPLRLVRLARFAAIFSNFSIHDSAAPYLKKIIESQELQLLAKERVTQEVIKAHQVNADPRKFWALLSEWGALNSLFDGWNFVITEQDFIYDINPDLLTSNDKVLVGYLAVLEKTRTVSVRKSLRLSDQVNKSVELLSYALAISNHDFSNSWEAILALIFKSRALQDANSLMFVWSIHPFAQQTISLEKLKEILDFLNQQDVAWIASLPGSQRKECLQQFYIKVLRDSYGAPQSIPH